MPTAATPSKLREAFFSFLFNEQEGYLCIAYADRGDPRKMKASFKQSFFEWPIQKKELSKFIDEQLSTKHLWYGVNLFAKPQRRTEQALAGRLVYADLDACNPSSVEPKPSVAYESSPGRFQALWRLDQTISPDIAADYSRRIAYRYSINGADKTGWDTTQLLRIPFTRNYKYPGAPEIQVILTNDEPLTPQLFEEIEIPPGAIAPAEQDKDVPKIEDLPPPDEILFQFERYLQKYDVLKLYYIEPEPGDDWSGMMWRLINTCIEAGMSEEQVFSLCYHAKCNKYERDKRPVRYLWIEIQKAYKAQKKFNIILSDFGPLTLPPLTPEPATETVIDKYMNWATEATDAVPIYHEISAFIVLSSLLSSVIQLKVEYDTVVPNLWALILGQSTLTRKTTAMALARNLISELDNDLEIASEGSIEGIMQALSLRPGEVSMFFRDEVSGFFDQVNKKDYLSGIPELFTHLYDVPRVFRRVLRKETIVVEKPIFVFYGGGIKDEVYSRLNIDNILSGFIPRFLVVYGETDISQIKPTGPFSTENLHRRKEVYDAVIDIYDRYKHSVPIKVAGQTFHKDVIFDAELTDSAWVKYQEIETAFTKQAYESNISNLALPTFERLSRSMLKMAVLLGAARQEPTNEQKFTVGTDDIQNAAYYIQKWGPHSIDLIYNCGSTKHTQMVIRLRNLITNHPGILHSDIMRWAHLSKRDMDMVMDTLLDRGEVRLTKIGKARKYWPI